MGGQGGKVSLANTADTDILEYILVKLAAKIVAKARTFDLVEVKDLADDLTEVGHTLEGEGENYRWKQRTTRLVFSYSV